MRSKRIKEYSELINYLKEQNYKYDFKIIDKAYSIAKMLHEGQKRISGDDYLVHVLNVAFLIAQLNLDTNSIVASLLHDSVEKGGYSIDKIDEEFGTEVAFIIDGLTTIKNITQTTKNFSSDSEDLKHLILNSTEDVRILIIRIAEKLDNIYTSDNLPEEIKTTSAKKIFNIYAPLAEYMGIGYFQRELEENAFRILNREEYEISVNSIKKITEKSEEIINQFKLEFEQILKNANVSYLNLYTRIKGIYSAYKKVKMKYTPQGEKVSEAEFFKLRDLFAARVILNTVEECYIVLGIVHKHWDQDPEEFDDYIAKPKDNGYRSIQTSIYYRNIYLEVQIRTKEMHEFNEFGPASHIAYKLGQTKNTGKSYTWTKELVKWQNRDILGEDIYKIKLFANSVFVFTPKGLLIRLEKGATPIDFAFRIHTEIGLRYAGALVNGKMVNKEYILSTGEVVEILLAPKLTVNSSWLNIVKSASTKQKIRKFLNT